MMEFFVIGIAFVAFGGILYAAYEAITHKNTVAK